jgi:tRNA-splicing ligase RtcB (3'-phosphate/5'-hydroxy nucleic acid ligase)
MQVIGTERIPIKIWASTVEETSIAQARNLANLPFAFKHVALMPDAHLGYGMPIGGVLATDDVVVPNAVGVDIGCGMIAAKTSLTHEELTPKLDGVLKQVQRTIPTGMHWHNKPQEHVLFAEAPDDPVIAAQLDRAKQQLGTLGGGNHFLELQVDDGGSIWAMVHSGSRNLGKQVADHYDKKARQLNQEWHSAVPKEWQLAFLPVETEEAQHYLSAMRFCMKFAEVNREIMLERIIEVLASEFSSLEATAVAHTHHNYVDIEHHFDRDVWVHRKGAVRARLQDTVIIPGSMGTASYIAEGLENDESFHTCSHGAGRVSGRKEMKRTITEADMLAAMPGVRLLAASDVRDEAPQAYKDIDQVMLDSKDLVKPVARLRPIGVVKG